VSWGHCEEGEIGPRLGRHRGRGDRKRTLQWVGDSKVGNGEKEGKEKARRTKTVAKYAARWKAGGSTPRASCSVPTGRKSERIEKVRG